MFLNNDIPEFLVEGEVNELSGDMITGKPFDCTEFCTPKTIKNLLLTRMANLPEYNLSFPFYSVFELMAIGCKSKHILILKNKYI